MKLSSLVCILAEGDYSRLVGTAGSIGLVLKSMKEWEALLPERQFCRIQRSVIINCERVERFEPWFNSSYQVYLQHLPKPFTMSRRLAQAVPRPVRGVIADWRNWRPSAANLKGGAEIAALSGKLAGSSASF